MDQTLSLSMITEKILVVNQEVFCAFVNVLSWFGYVEKMSDERMAKKIYDGKVIGKSSRRPRLTFKYIILKILEEERVKSVRIPRGICIKRLITVQETKEV